MPLTISSLHVSVVLEKVSGTEHIIMYGGFNPPTPEDGRIRSLQTLSNIEAIKQTAPHTQSGWGYPVSTEHRRSTDIIDDPVEKQCPLRKFLTVALSIGRRVGPLS